MRHELFAGVGLDDLARHAAEGNVRNDVRKIVVGLRQTEAQAVAIDRLHARYFGVVIELPGLLRLCRYRVQAGDLAFEHESPLRAVGGVHEAHVAVHEVLRGQLAFLALEGGVGGEENSLAQLEDVGLALVGHFGHGLGRHRHKLRRSRQIIVSQQALEDRFIDRVRVQVGNAARIESCLAGWKVPMDDFARIGLRECIADWRQSSRERQHRRQKTPWGTPEGPARRPPRPAQHRCASSSNGA